MLPLPTQLVLPIQYNKHQIQLAASPRDAYYIPFPISLEVLEAAVPENSNWTIPLIIIFLDLSFLINGCDRNMVDNKGSGVLFVYYFLGDSVDLFESVCNCAVVSILVLIFGYIALYSTVLHLSCFWLHYLYHCYHHIYTTYLYYYFIHIMFVVALFI